jgi:hypothetical protein
MVTHTHGTDTNEAVWDIVRRWREKARRGQGGSTPLSSWMSWNRLYQSINGEDFFSL